MPAAHLTFDHLRLLVEGASCRAVVILPALSKGLGRALASASARLPGRVLAVVDSDERVFRAGYGTLEGLKAAQAGGCPVLRRQGLRLGCVLVDEKAAFLALPPALAEAPPEREVDPVNAALVPPDVVFTYLREVANGPELDQVLQPIAGLPAEAQEDAVARIQASAQATAHPALAVPVHGEEVAALEAVFKFAPPLDFQLHQQSLVYTSLLLSVDIAQVGADPTRRTLALPKGLLRILGTPGAQGFASTYDLPLAGVPVESWTVAQELKQLRTRVARELGRPFGTVLLRRDQEAFEAGIADLNRRLSESGVVASEAYARAAKDQAEAIREALLAQVQVTRGHEEALELLARLSDLRPLERDRARWAQGETSDQVRHGVLEALVTLILQRRIEAASARIGGARIEYRYREFTLEDMDAQAFHTALTKAYRKDPAVRPYLDQRAVIGRPVGDPWEAELST